MHKSKETKKKQKGMEKIEKGAASYIIISFDQLSSN
jgi:hypothetical protein